MDADDISESERIEKEMKYMLDNNLDIVGCRLAPFSNNELYKSGPVPQFSYISNKLLRVTNCIGHPTWIVKKKIFEELVGYRDINSCEDYDFLLRAVLCGYKVACTNEKLLKYRINPLGISQKLSSEQRITSCHLKSYYRKNKVMPISVYKEWVNSEKCKKEYRQDQKYENLKELIKKNRNCWMVISSIPRLLICRKFYDNIYNTLYFRLWMMINGWNRKHQNKINSQKKVSIDK